MDNNEMFVSDDLLNKMHNLIKKKSNISFEEYVIVLNDLDYEIRNLFDYIISNSDDDFAFIYSLDLDENVRELFFDYVSVKPTTNFFRKKKLHDIDIIEQYLKEIGKIPRISDEDERKLLKAYFDGDKNAGDLLVVSNLRLVVFLAKQYMGCGLDYLDLIQAGSEAFVKNMNRYDMSRGVKFTTYMTWWIKQGMLYAIATDSRSIKVSFGMNNDIRKVRNVMHSFFTKNGRLPSNIEIADELGISVLKVNKILMCSQPVISLDAPVNENGLVLEEVLPGDGFEEPDSKVASEDFYDLLDEVLSLFSKRNQEIIKLRFGIGFDDCMTLEAIGNIYNITKESVRRVINKFLDAFRSFEYINQLAPYYYSNYKDSDVKKIVRK